MAEYTPVSKINYDLFKQNYDPNLPYNQQSQTIQQKYNEDLFNKYSSIASEEPKLGFFEKLGSGLESLFSAYGAEPDYVNPNLAEMLAQQNYQNTLAYSPMFDNRNRFKEDIIPERMIDAPMDLESTMAGSILDKGITNRSLIGNLPNLNYRNYNLSNLFNTTEPDLNNFALARRLMTQPGLDTFTGINKGVYDPYGIKVEDGRFSYDMNKTSLADYQKPKNRFTGMDLESGYLDRAGSSDQDIYAEQEKQKGDGIGGLFRFLLGLAVPLPGKGLEGIRSLNQRIQGSDFGQATSLMDYLDMRKYGGAQGRRDASARTMAQARGLQKQIDQRPTATQTYQDRARGDRPGGANYSAPSRPSRTSPQSGMQAERTRSRDLGSMRGGVGR